MPEWGPERGPQPMAIRKPLGQIMGNDLQQIVATRRIENLTTDCEEALPLSTT